MNPGPMTRIWIVRRGSGKLEVTPSPALLTPDFVVRNLTDTGARVEFDGKYVSPSTADVPARGQHRFTVAGSGPVFFEYDVRVGPAIAEGGSRPGAIIDP